jgi:hypothetical protein
MGDASIIRWGIGVNGRELPEGEGAPHDAKVTIAFGIYGHPSGKPKITLRTDAVIVFDRQTRRVEVACHAGSEIAGAFAGAWSGSLQAGRVAWEGEAPPRALDEAVIAGVRERAGQEN